MKISGDVASIGMYVKLSRDEDLTDPIVLKATL
jgi:hypothetical protein